MKAEDKKKYKHLLGENQVFVDIRTVENGVDRDGFPNFKNILIDPPSNFNQIRIIEPLNGAIVEVLHEEANNA